VAPVYSHAAPPVDGSRRTSVIIQRRRTNVVVHVETAAGFRGVKVSAVFVADDHPGQPHMHAYTGLI
jgi:hypothetical protein